jgi:hypothetical protein
MYREWLATVQRPNAAAELALYLSTTATAEGWQSEYKAAAHDPDFGVREAVAALGNSRGGEVFVGVDDAGQVLGSPVTLDALNSVLRQTAATPSPWRIVDLLETVGQITPVAVANAGGSAYVIEVKSYDRPAFVIDSGGRLQLPVRSGNQTHKMDCATAIEFFRQRSRASVLRGCLAELRTFSLQLSPHRSLEDGLPDPLPFIQSITQDGTASTILTASDRTAVFGEGTGGARTTGAVDTYYRAVRRIRAQLDLLPQSERNVAVRNLPVVGMEFSNLEGDARSRVDQF